MIHTMSPMRTLTATIVSNDTWPKDSNELLVRLKGWWSLNYWLLT